MTKVWNGIPTTYKEVAFRSRLEARWAVMFDSLGWAWEYEPMDLAGYIPDFILPFAQPLLVEVKAATSLAQLEPHVAKIERSGWKGEALLVGSWLFRAESWDRAALGLLGGSWGSGGPLVWDAGVAGVCRSCRCPSIMSDEQSYHCRVCGSHDSGLVDAGLWFESVWRSSGSAVQWQPKPKPSVSLSSLSRCFDCGVLPGVPHEDGCDIARCTSCGDQWLSCGHREHGVGGGAIWSGWWTGREGG